MCGFVVGGEDDVEEPEDLGVEDVGVFVFAEEGEIEVGDVGLCLEVG